MEVGSKIGFTFRLGEDKYTFGRVDIELTGINPELDVDAQIEMSKAAINKIWPVLLERAGTEIDDVLAEANKK
jgi:hypothetical protein|tara:strand:+ start:206 stop:424 length:219 start_codon:yes stop_codon:yes gene_type:complete